MQKHYWVLAAVLPAACISSSGGDLPCSTTTTSPMVPGAQVTWDTPSCTMQSGSGGMFSYTLELGSALSFTLGPHGACSATMDDPSSFISAFVTGSGGQYCPDCDQGTCPEDPGESITIPAGSYSGMFQFPGDAWDGPAGDNAPLGAPLPAGSYVATFQMVVPSGTLGAALPILLEQ